jgi:hypothetical protein
LGWRTSQAIPATSSPLMNQPAALYRWPGFFSGFAGLATAIPLFVVDLDLDLGAAQVLESLRSMASAFDFTAPPPIALEAMRAAAEPVG